MDKKQEDYLKTWQTFVLSNGEKYYTVAGTLAQILEGEGVMIIASFYIADDAQMFLQAIKKQTN